MLRTASKMISTCDLIFVTRPKDKRDLKLEISNDRDSVSFDDHKHFEMEPKRMEQKQTYKTCVLCLH